MYLGGTGQASPSRIRADRRLLPLEVAMAIALVGLALAMIAGGAWAAMQGYEIIDKSLNIRSFGKDLLTSLTQSRRQHQ